MSSESLPLEKCRYFRGQRSRSEGQQHWVDVPHWKFSRRVHIPKSLTPNSSKVLVKVTFMQDRHTYRRDLKYFTLPIVPGKTKLKYMHQWKSYTTQTPHAKYKIPTTYDLNVNGDVNHFDSKVLGKVMVFLYGNTHRWKDIPNTT